MICKLSNGIEEDLKERLIKNTKNLMEGKGGCYPVIIDYNRQLFYELYELDIFCFINDNLVDEYCKDTSRDKNNIL